uniref:Apolipoprotein B mRNA editing enzyme, catalytic polypeptide n=2 Tax=Equus caballus TaxID=9796 RepID=A0A3Q2H4B3_HORSE
MPRGRARERQRRNPMEKLDAEAFSFHFLNMEFVYDRNCSYLCYQVEGRLSGSPVLSEQGVFPNEVCGKTRRHAELCFLDWFRGRLSPDEYYCVTWFISWSPCSNCAREVAEFLKRHRNVELSIFAARLYYCRDHEQGLQSLCNRGAQLAVMLRKDFTYCWDNFVHNSGREFSPWENIDANSDLLARKLEDLLKNPMEKLHRKTFSFHFRNLKFAKGRKCSYLCYRVEGRLSGSPGLSEQGVFLNEVCDENCRHAELCFLHWFRGRLSPHADYRVTWFISWSPCSNCAREVAEFLKQHRNVELHISAARLYYWQRNKPGLRNLRSSGAQLAIMFFWDFRDCWDNFVHNSGRHFIPWKKINVNSRLLATKLEDLLKNPLEKLHPNTFSFHFCNLEFAYDRKYSYLCYQVEGRLSGSPGLSEQGVFLNEVCDENCRHAELCFLHWFRGRLSPDEYYHVTWFISWSPCSNCARQVAEFLKQHRNVELSIFAARLYYWQRNKPDLRNLCSSGAQLAIMFYQDFRYCWDNFVHNSGREFIPWEKINVNSRLLATNLEEILNVGSCPTDRRALPRGRAREKQKRWVRG